MIKSIFGMGKVGDSVSQCVSDAVKDFHTPKLILFFSEEKHFPEYAEKIHELFPDAISMGCSTYRTWNGSGTQKDILNVVALEDGVTCAANVIEKADSFALEYADNVRDCLDAAGATDNSVCVEFTVPYKRTEEYALMALNSVLLKYGIPVMGGTAANVCADTLVSDEAYVALNGKVYRDGCVFAIIHNLDGAVYFRRENIYEPLTGRGLLVTKANNLTRTIMTFDNESALDVYAKELNVPVGEASKYYFHYPMGRCVDNDTYVTAIQGDNPNFSMRFHARVHEGTHMMVMKEGDYKRITRETLEEMKSKVKSPSLVIMFHCVARTILFEENGYIDEYEKLLVHAFPNFIGLACLGEQFETKNFNHTMMLLVFE